MLEHNIKANISWNLRFTSQHNVTFYRVNMTQTMACSAVCVPFELCQCTMPAVGEVASISISATVEIRRDQLLYLKLKHVFHHHHQSVLVCLCITMHLISQGSTFNG